MAKPCIWVLKNREANMELKNFDKEEFQKEVDNRWEELLKLEEITKRD